MTTQPKPNESPGETVATDDSNSPLSATPPEGDWLITIAASAGGIPALEALVASLPHDLPAAVAILQHRMPQSTESYLNTILAR